MKWSATSWKVPGGSITLWKLPYGVWFEYREDGEETVEITEATALALVTAAEALCKDAEARAAI
jgi:hypothetical protein